MRILYIFPYFYFPDFIKFYFSSIFRDFTLWVLIYTSCVLNFPYCVLLGQAILIRLRFLITVFSPSFFLLHWTLLFFFVCCKCFLLSFIFSPFDFHFIFPLAFLFALFFFPFLISIFVLILRICLRIFVRSRWNSRPLFLLCPYSFLSLMLPFAAILWCSCSLFLFLGAFSVAFTLACFYYSFSPVHFLLVVLCCAAIFSSISWSYVQIP